MGPNARVTPSPLRLLLASSALYTLGDTAGRVLLFLLVPVWTHYLTPAEYGVYELLRVAGLVLSTVAALALPAAVVRQFVELKPERFRTYYGSVAVFQLFVVLALVIVAELWGPQIAGALIPGISYRPLGRLLVVSSLLGVLPQIPLALLQYQQRPGTYVALTFSLFGCKAALSLYFVVVLKAGVSGLLWAEVLSVLLLLPIALWLLAREVRLSLEGSSLRDALAYSLPLVPHALAYLALSSVDRYILGHYQGAGPVGLYGIAGLFSSGLAVLSLALQKALRPFLFQCCQRLTELGNSPGSSAPCVAGEVQEQRRLLRSALGLNHQLVGWAAVTLVVLSPEILRLFMAKSYLAALPLIPWLVGGAALYGSYLIFVNVLYFYRRTVLLPLLSGSCAALNLLLNYLLVPSQGALAAAMISALCYLLLAISVQVAARRCLAVPYSVRRLAGLVVVVVIAAAGSLGLDHVAPLASRLGLKAALLLVATAALFLAGTSRPKDWRSLLTALSQLPARVGHRTSVEKKEG